VRRWAWLLVLAIGSALLLLEHHAVVATGNLDLVPSLLLLGAVLLPVTFLLYLDGRAPVYDLPLSALLVCGLVGGVLGTVVASLLEYNTLLSLGVLPTVMIGLSEETAKLLVPLAVLAVTPYRTNPADGLLVGVAVGIGFAVLETLGYGFVTLLATGGDLTATVELLLVRGILSPAGHAAWTGLAAVALWYAYLRRWRPRALLAAAGTFVLVVLLHAAWDTILTWYGYLIIGLLSFGLLLHQAHRAFALSARIPAQEGRPARTGRYRMAGDRLT
jgi:RsiW-degrading membrane proteinase PrsW (M82 family)